MAETVEYYGTGRRKSSVARVFLRPGSGAFRVNNKPFDEYFVTDTQRIVAKQPLVTSETSGTFDIVATCSGGGVNGQAGAVKMGIARALLHFNAELRGKLKAEGYLRRDPRERENIAGDRTPEGQALRRVLDRMAPTTTDATLADPKDRLEIAEAYRSAAGLVPRPSACSGAR